MNAKEFYERELADGKKPLDRGEKLCLTFGLFAMLAIGAVIGKADSHNKVKAYRSYYIATESLLDDLNNEYNWVDSYDDEAYYNAVLDIEQANGSK